MCQLPTAFKRPHIYMHVTTIFYYVVCVIYKIVQRLSHNG